jgi:hypothetical protein
MFLFMKNLQKYFWLPNCQANLYKGNIFNFLDTTDKKFSIYDFDLMCNIKSDNFIETLSKSIKKTSQEMSVVNIATTIGRKISEQEYNDRMPKCLLESLSDEMEILDTFSDGYNDRVIPMRYEFIALRRKENTTIN